jgi:hypothetical protein
MSLLLSPSATSYGSDALSAPLGSTVPRLFTPPLVEGPPGPCGCGCALTPETSFGFDVVEFAEVILGQAPYPWQRFALIHGGEVLPDGRPRARTVLVLVSRQNGKTEIGVDLSAYWQFIDEVPLVLGTSTKTEYAKESWLKAVKLVEGAEALADQRAKRWTRNTNGEQESWTEAGSRYKIAASNAEGGRSLTVHRLLLDELRQHHDYSAWDASVPAGNAVRDFQAWALSNAGDDRSVVLNELRAACIKFIESGEGDPRTMLMEWSADDDADPFDVDQLAQANPSVGYGGLEMDTLISQARKAVAAGGQALTGFKTENMCIRVKMLNPAIDPGAWRRCFDPGDLSSARSRLAVCLDISPDGSHATLAAAAVMPDDRVRMETVASWDGPGCTDRLRRDLPGWISRLKPQALGWFPSGPAAALTSDLADRRKSGARGWPPRGVTVAEIRGEMAAVVMGFAEQVTAGRVVHSGQALLDAHVAGAERLRRGDTWVLSRRGEGNVDAAYAAAGAVHLARGLPPRSSKPFLITSD